MLSSILLKISSSYLAFPRLLYVPGNIILYLFSRYENIIAINKENIA